MSCGCDSYECLDIFMNPCNVGTFLGIEATETGTWTGRIEFNGAWKYFGVAVDDGVEIAILTQLLNEQYIHELRLYKVDGTLFGCYKLNSKFTQNVLNAPVPEPPSNVWQWAKITVGAQAAAIQSDYFKGDISPIIWINEQPIDWVAQGVTQDASTGTLTFTGDLQAGTIIYIQYKNLP